MGYDVHITRADHWSVSEEEPINAEEWLALIASDPELTRITSAWTDGIDASWNGSADHDKYWFAWRVGHVFTKYPDELALQKMSEMASRLGAMVQGDEGEIYVDYRQFDRVYAIVRVSEFQNMPCEVAVVKILRSKALAEAEVARLNKINDYIAMRYFVESTRLDNTSTDSP